MTFLRHQHETVISGEINEDKNGLVVVTTLEAFLDITFEIPLKMALLIDGVALVTGAGMFTTFGIRTNLFCHLR